jgi:membrane fusion protein (multidrug efflux system)
MLVPLGSVYKKVQAVCNIHQPLFQHFYTFNTMSKKKNRALPFILGGVLLLGGIFGFNKVRYAMTHEDTENAYLETDIITIAPKVQGYITQIRVQENQLVQAGDTLFVLDNRDFLMRVRQAEAALHNAEANVGFTAANASSAGANVGTAAANVRTANAGVETSMSTVPVAQANLEAAQAKARQATQDFTRYTALLPQRAITQQQYDVVKANKESAEAQVQAAQAQLQTANRQVEASRLQSDAGKSQQSAVQSQADAAGKGVAVARTLVEQRQLDLDNARLNLSYTVIIAPVGGFVAKKAAQIGQLANIGSPLCSIVNNDKMWVTANFKETQVGAMTVGQAVTVHVDAYEGTTFNGKIESIAPATGAKFSLLPAENASGNFVKVVQRIPVRIALTDASDAEKPLRAGMSALVIVPVQ